MDRRADFGEHDSVLGSYKAVLTSDLLRREVWAWTFLAICSLAIAGLFALFIALSRLPGSEQGLPWLANFFHKGLVIHVVFSFVVWFLIVFDLIASLATFRIARNDKVRLRWIGLAGVLTIGLSFPILFIPSFIREAEAVRNNYIPVIEHPLYEFGLVLLFVGAALPIIRFIANLPRRFSRLFDPVPFAAAFASGIYLIALSSMAIVLGLSRSLPEVPYEHLFWGSGHVLQFLNALLMICGWYLLARLSPLDSLFDAEIYRLAAVLLLVFVLPALLFYVKFEAFSARQDAAFTNLQYALALPLLLVGGNALIGILRHRHTAGSLPWSDPAFLCLAFSLLVFGVGGILGFLVDGADTRTPAHYHGVLAGISLAFMGLFICFFLPLLGRDLRAVRAVHLPIMLFGVGQMLASVGLFLAGGYGAPRKVPGESHVVIDGVVIGMHLNGIGALVAVVGGALFVFTVFAALLRAPRGQQ